MGCGALIDRGAIIGRLGSASNWPGVDESRSTRFRGGTMTPPVSR